MGRTVKMGLDYFPFDVDFFQDLKVRKLINRQGGKAVVVYALLLCFIYKSGYYMWWDEELPFIISEQTGFEEAYIREVIKSCLSVGLFSKELFDSDKVMTSRGIQERYESINKLCKRKVNITKFSLILPDEKSISSEEMTISSEKMTISSEKKPISSENFPLKKRKEKKNKITLSKSLSSQTRDLVEDDSREREIFFRIMFFKNCRKPDEEVCNFVNHYQATGWMRDGQKIVDKVAVCENWAVKDQAKLGKYPDKFLKMWKELYKQLNEVKEAKPHLDLMLNGLFSAEIADMAVKLAVSEDLKKFLESNLGYLRPLFLGKYFKDYKLVYKPCKNPL